MAKAKHDFISGVMNVILNGRIDEIGSSLIILAGRNHTGTMVGNYAGHTLSEAYQKRNVAEKEAETTTKHKAAQAKARAEAQGRNQHRLFSTKKQQGTRAGLNTGTAPTQALDDWYREVKSLAVPDVPSFDMNDTTVTPTTSVNDESWSMRQLERIDNALEPYANALDTFNSYAEPVAKGLLLAASGYGLAVAIPAAIPTLLRIAAPFGSASMETMGIPTITMTSFETSLAGTGVFIGGVTKYGSELLSKLSLFGPESAGGGSIPLRTFQPKDLGVKELIEEIEAKFPGSVKHAEIEIYGEGGKTLTDFDIVTDTHVIQVKVGGGNKITHQLMRSQAITDLEVIGFDANSLIGRSQTFKPSVVKYANQQGFKIYNNVDDLFNAIKQAKEQTNARCFINNGF